MLLHRALAELGEQCNRAVETLMTEYPVPYPLVVGRVRAGCTTARVTCGSRTAPDEAVELDEVVRVTEALVLAVLRSCGTT